MHRLETSSYMMCRKSVMLWSSHVLLKHVQSDCKSVIYIDNAKDLWDDLNERFSE